MTAKALEKSTTIEKFEIGDVKMELSLGGERALVYEIVNGSRRWLFTVPGNLDWRQQKLLIEAFLSGRERGQVEGRNELRQRLGGLMNTMESV